MRWVVLPGGTRRRRWGGEGAERGRCIHSHRINLFSEPSSLGYSSIKGQLAHATPSPIHRLTHQGGGGVMTL